MHSRLAPAGLVLARGLLAFIFSLYGATAILAAQASGPDVEGLAPRVGDEWWIIDSRSIVCDNCLSRCPPDPSRLRTQRYMPCQGWRRSSVDEFLLAGGEESLDDSDTITVFYVTGNRDDVDETLEDGLQVYATLVACSPCVRIRFVIWSWPSDKVCGPLRDFRVKAERTDCESYLLSSVLVRLGSSARLSLVGYSFGARVIAGALHLAAGGAIDCCALPHAAASLSTRVVFFAPAFDNDWLLPGRRNGLALTQVDRLWTSYNLRDPVLKRYPIIVKRADPVALGYAGLARGPWPAEYSARLCAENVSNAIGKTHWMEAYLDSPLTASRLRAFTLGPRTSPAAANVAAPLDLSPNDGRMPIQE